MQLLAPLDALRQGAFRAALARPAVASWLKTKDRRIALVAALGVVVALVLTCVAPAAMLVLTPIVLGVPHVASDARYLVLRPRVPRAWICVLAATSVLFVALRLAEGADPELLPFARVEVAAGLAWICASAAYGARSSGAWGRFAVAAPILLALACAALARPELTRVVLAHAHNVVAVVLWVVLFRRARAAAVPAIALLLGAVLFALSGAPVRIAHGLGTDSAFGMDLVDAAVTLAPGVPLGLGLGIAATYVLLQGVHYAVWLGWIPQEDVRGEGTLTFRMTARGLVRDFGRAGLAALGLGWLAVVLGAFANARAARDTYLSLASFHAYLELAMLAYFLCLGLRARSKPSAALRGELRACPTAPTPGR